MTDSLIYDIIKRNNFRCQICVSTAEKDVKLHVDHIVPVAKGGQTPSSRLRTLCDRDVVWEKAIKCNSVG